MVFLPATFVAVIPVSIKSLPILKPHSLLSSLPSRLLELLNQFHLKSFIGLSLCPSVLLCYLPERLGRGLT